MNTVTGGLARYVAECAERAKQRVQRQHATALREQAEVERERATSEREQAKLEAESARRVPISEGESHV